MMQPVPGVCSQPAPRVQRPEPDTMHLQGAEVAGSLHGARRMRPPRRRCSGWPHPSRNASRFPLPDTRVPCTRSPQGGGTPAAGPKSSQRQGWCCWLCPTATAGSAGRERGARGSTSPEVCFIDCWMIRHVDMYEYHVGDCRHRVPLDSQDGKDGWVRKGTGVTSSMGRRPRGLGSGLPSGLTRREEGSDPKGTPSPPPSAA